MPADFDNYTMQVSPPTTNFGTIANPNFTVTLGDSPVTVNFGLFEPALPPPPPPPFSISGSVWNDLNSNGNYDAGEQPLAGVTVILLQGSTFIDAATT